MGVGEITVQTELGIVLDLVMLDRFAANGAGRPAPWSGESTTRSVSRQLTASDSVAGFIAHGALAVDPAGSARCQRAWRRHFHVSLSAVPLGRVTVRFITMTRPEQPHKTPTRAYGFP